MSRRVVFSPEAEEQPADLYHYIAAGASPETAARYTEAIISYCEDLRMFPRRGTMCDDIMSIGAGSLLVGRECEVSSRVHAL